MSALALTAVSHSYGAAPVVQAVDLTVTAGEVVCLLGPSGCGKTTALRLAAGLEDLQQGRVDIAGRTVAGDRRNVPPEQRGVGIVFQDYALFPHLTVRENVRFGLPQRREADGDKAVMAALNLIGLSDFAGAYPHTLSGGQQQRVALARALAPKPRVLLLDEPFSGLDARLRDSVRDRTLHILKDSETAVLMVTHDPEEAMFMADRIAVMNAGRIEQVGPPSEIYFSPATAFVASFMGDVNRLPAIVRGGEARTPLGAVGASGFEEGTPVEVLVRPEALRIVRGERDAIPKDRAAEVIASRLLGRTSLIHLRFGDTDVANRQAHRHLHSRMPGCCLPKKAEIVEVTLDPDLAFVFPASTS